jgi:hypothetical protein
VSVKFDESEQDKTVCVTHGITQIGLNASLFDLIASIVRPDSAL